MSLLFTNATLVLPDRLAPAGYLLCAGDRITAVGIGPPPAADTVIDCGGDYLSPGFVDIHIHGGGGADFMDATPAAFTTIARCHASHGVTSLVPTTCVAELDLIARVLDLCRAFRTQPTGGSRVLGAHLYGPYFAPVARGVHPAAPLRPPVPEEFLPLLGAGDGILTATVAPELPGAEAFARACVERGVRVNAGHSYATFDQMEESLAWGVRHVDHLFCAMSDRTRLRASQPFPMRGGVLEATLHFDALTTELIADGQHLTRALYLLAHKCKGSDRLALISDVNRALDMPDGDYYFGPEGAGELVRRRGPVCIMPETGALGGPVQSLGHGVREFWRATGLPVWEVIRMASLTPARIVGRDVELGSLAVGKLADVVRLDAELRPRGVWVAGIEYTGAD